MSKRPSPSVGEAASSSSRPPRNKIVRRAKTSPTDLSEKSAAERNSEWESTAGTILRVELRNFMCHQHLVYEPNQRLNFLSGANGSGKSAVLAAILFGLGGSARTAERGRSNAAFIRTGQPSASVDITLSNEGEYAYRQARYGSAITINRTITAKSGSYKCVY